LKAIYSQYNKIVVNYIQRHIKIFDVLGLLLLGTIAFFPLLGYNHLFDWDEINFAEASREMLVSHNYGQVQINFEPFYEKPPFFFWLQALCMHFFGIDAYGARFPNACFGLLTLVTLYWMGKHYKNRIFGLYWALLYLSALLPHFYFRTGIIDPVFNYFIALSLYAIAQLWTYCKKNTQATDEASRFQMACSRFSPPCSWLFWALLGGTSLGIAILTKGPVAALLLSLCWLIYYLIRGNNQLLGKSMAYLFRSRHWTSSTLYADIAEKNEKLQQTNSRYACAKIGWKTWFYLVITAAIIPCIWIFYEVWQHGWKFLHHFFIYQVTLLTEPIAGHNQPFHYHFFIILIGCFPASIFATKRLIKHPMHSTKPLYLLMWLMFWVVMVFFSLAKTKIVHYSSMAYYPVTFFAALYLFHINTKKIRASWMMHFLFLLMVFSMSSIWIGLPLVGIFKTHFYTWFKDMFIRACLEMPVPWSYKGCLVGGGYLVAYLTAYLFFYRNKINHYLVAMAIGTNWLLTLGAYWLVPPLEAHIQQPTITFYQSLANKPVYVNTLGFKSYAPLFYFKQPPLSLIQKNIDWQLHGQIDQPAFFVVKVSDRHLLLPYKDVIFLYQKGGFAFYKREAMR